MPDTFFIISASTVSQRLSTYKLIYKLWLVDPLVDSWLIRTTDKPHSILDNEHFLQWSNYSNRIKWKVLLISKEENSKYILRLLAVLLFTLIYIATSECDVFIASIQSFVFNVLKQDIKKPFLVHYTTVSRAAYESSDNYALFLEINCIISKY